MNLHLIVEGHGDVLAAPVLLRRFVEAARECALSAGNSSWNVEVARPLRFPSGQLVRRAGIEEAISKALMQEPDAILILFDGDRDCPADFGPRVRGWVVGMAWGVPCEVVMPNREYEAWLLASMESIRGERDIKNDADPHPRPEEPPGAKAQLDARMRWGKSYVEAADQAALSSKFSMAAAYSRSRSFRKLASAFGELLQATECTVAPWPPAGWDRFPRDRQASASLRR